jgi:hypothetical protein
VIVIWLLTFLCIVIMPLLLTWMDHIFMYHDRHMATNMDIDMTTDMDVNMATDKDIDVAANMDNDCPCIFWANIKCGPNI